MPNRSGWTASPEKSPECPSCGSTGTQTSQENEQFVYGEKGHSVELSAQIPVRTCLSCGFQFTDSEAEVAHHEAVCRHLGVLTPGEILALRARYGLSRSVFAELTHI